MIVAEGNRHRQCAFGCLRPPRGADRPHALAALAGALEEILAQLAPDLVVIETPFAARFPGSALALAEARGALLAALGRWGGVVMEIAPARVKALVVGHGSADKKQVAFIVQRELGLAAQPPSDAADALALALCALRAGPTVRLDIPGPEA